MCFAYNKLLNCHANWWGYEDVFIGQNLTIVLSLFLFIFINLKQHALYLILCAFFSDVLDECLLLVILLIWRHSFKKLFCFSIRISSRYCHIVNILIVTILSRSNIPFVRLDGTLSLQQREKVLKQFSEDSSILVCD